MEGADLDAAKLQIDGSDVNGQKVTQPKQSTLYPSALSDWIFLASAYRLAYRSRRQPLRLQ